MIADTMPGLIDSIPAGEVDDDGRKDGLSQTPGAIRARLYRARKGKDGAAPKSPRAPRRKSSTQRSRAPRSLYPEIAATLSMVNMIVALSPVGTRPPSDALPAGRVGDELDDAEIGLLARALDSQCQRSPRFRKQVERILGAGAGGQIVTVVGMIAMRRASRHGLAPDMLDPMLGAMMAGGDMNALASFTPPASTIDDRVDDVTGERPPIPTPDAPEPGYFETL